MSNKLVITRGLPGSGKSRAAREWVLQDPDNRAEVNRDWLRLMVGGFEVGSSAQEAMITKLSHNGIRDLLRLGKDVISSDTNLPQKYVNQLATIARNQGAEVEIWDMTDVPLEVALERNASRTDKNPVPVSVIRRMYHQHVDGKGYPLPGISQDSAGKAPDPYVAPVGTVPAFICDIDGTMAIHRGRSPYDYSKVSTDIVDHNVYEVARSLIAAGYKMIFVSGRPDINNVRQDTEEWIEKHVRLPYEALYMRPASRLNINDAIIKRDLFDENIRDKYDVLVVLDDRDRVVSMWREQLGLRTLQVRPGDF